MNPEQIIIDSKLGVPIIRDELIVILHEGFEYSG
jgi:hypothetical protein